MNVGRTVRRTIRPLWIAGLAATVWVNRAGVRSALGFGKKAPDGRGLISGRGLRWTGPR